MPEFGEGFEAISGDVWRGAAGPHPGRRLARMVEFGLTLCRRRCFTAATDGRWLQNARAPPPK
eukprot:2874135-Pyramimonas_sp.AAC.1